MPIKIITDEGPKSENSLEFFKKFLEQRGYKIIIQKPYEEINMVDNEIVVLPFTNGRFYVLLKKDMNNKWKYFNRAREEKKFEEILRTEYYKHIPDPNT